MFSSDLLSGVSPSTSDLFGMNPTETDPDWTYDPNEPRYCICNQVSYGDMVACDNDDVSLYSLISYKKSLNYLKSFLVLK